MVSPLRRELLADGKPIELGGRAFDVLIALIEALGAVQGLDWARRQGALSWELPCATSVARLWSEQGQTERARGLLAPVFGRFTEGFETADLRVAQTLLGSLHNRG